MGERFVMDVSCLFQPCNMVEKVTMVVSCLFHAVYKTASWNECPILGKSVHLSKSLESVINLFMNFAATNFLENVIRFCNYDVFKLMVIVSR